MDHLLVCNPCGVLSRKKNCTSVFSPNQPADKQHFHSTSLLLFHCLYPHYMETQVCSSVGRRGTVYDASNIGPVQTMKNKRSIYKGKEMFKEYTYFFLKYCLYQYNIWYFILSRTAFYNLHKHHGPLCQTPPKRSDFERLKIILNYWESLLKK